MDQALAPLLQYDSETPYVAHKYKFAPSFSINHSLHEVHPAISHGEFRSLAMNAISTTPEDLQQRAEPLEQFEFYTECPEDIAAEVQ